MLKCVLYMIFSKLSTIYCSVCTCITLFCTVKSADNITHGIYVYLNNSRSLVAERSAHNGFAVGSIPAGSILLKGLVLYR